MRFIIWPVVTCVFVVLARCTEAGNQVSNRWMEKEEDGYFLDSEDSDTWDDPPSVPTNETDSIANPQNVNKIPSTLKSNTSLVGPNMDDQKLAVSDNNSDNSNLTLGDKIKRFMGLNNFTTHEKETPAEQKAPQFLQRFGLNRALENPNETLVQPVNPILNEGHQGSKDYVKPEEAEGPENRNAWQSKDTRKRKILRDSETPGKHNSNEPGSKTLELPKVPETYNLKEKRQLPNILQAPGKEVMSTSMVSEEQKGFDNKLPEEKKIGQKIKLKVPKEYLVPVEKVVNASSQPATVKTFVEVSNATAGLGVVVNNITIFENITIPRNVTVFKNISMVDNRNGTSKPKPGMPVPVSPPKSKVPVHGSYKRPEAPIPSLTAMPKKTPSAQAWSPLPLSMKQKKNITAHTKASNFASVTAPNNKTKRNSSSRVTSIREGDNNIIIPHNITVIVNKDR